MKASRENWISFLLFLLCFCVAPQSVRAATPSTIQTEISASYTDLSANTFTTNSNVVSITETALALAMLSSSSPVCSSSGALVANSTNTDVNFTLTNTGNVAATYLVSSATLSQGTLVALAFIDASGNRYPITVGSTLSPSIATNATITIRATVASGTIAVGTPLTLGISVSDGAHDVSSTASASACITVVPGPAITAPTGAASTIALSLNGQTVVAVSPGGSLDISVSFQNSGTLPAQNVVYSNILPAGVTIVPGSLLINNVPTSSGLTINGSTISIAIGALAPNTPITISFRASVSPAEANGASLADTARISASNAPTVSARDANIFIGFANILYNALKVTHDPVSGAVVTLLHQGGTPIVLPSPGIAPNTDNRNPFTTGPDGKYGFLFPAANATQVFEVDVAAPGFRNRRMQLSLVPTAVGGLFDATLSALDGQGLAKAGSYDLTTSSQNVSHGVIPLDASSATGPTVTLAAVNGFFGNIPLYTLTPIVMTVAFDRTSVSAGDRVLITITISGNAATFSGISLTNILPGGLALAPAVPTLDGAPFPALVAGNRQTWTLPDVAKNHTIVFAAVVLPSSRDGSTLTDTATFAGSDSAGGSPVTATASASLSVVPGIFSERMLLIGRITEATSCTQPHLNDHGVAGIRVYLEDGELAVTDKNGRYSFPAAAPVKHVVALDATTFPPRDKACPVGRGFAQVGGTRRLVHGIFDTDTLEDVNFVLQSSL